MPRTAVSADRGRQLPSCILLHADSSRCRWPIHRVFGAAVSARPITLRARTGSPACSAASVTSAGRAVRHSPRAAVLRGDGLAEFGRRDRVGPVQRLQQALGQAAGGARCQCRRAGAVVRPSRGLGPPPPAAKHDRRRRRSPPRRADRWTRRQPAEQVSGPAALPSCVATLAATRTAAARPRGVGGLQQTVGPCRGERTVAAQSQRIGEADLQRPAPAASRRTPSPAAVEAFRGRAAPPGVRGRRRTASTTTTTASPPRRSARWPACAPSTSRSCSCSAAATSTCPWRRWPARPAAAAGPSSSSASRGHCWKRRLRAAAARRPTSGLDSCGWPTWRKPWRRPAPGAGRRRRPAFAGLHQLRRLRQLRAPRRALPRAGPRSSLRRCSHRHARDAYRPARDRPPAARPAGLPAARRPPRCC